MPEDESTELPPLEKGKEVETIVNFLNEKFNLTLSVQDIKNRSQQLLRDLNLPLTPTAPAIDGEVFIQHLHAAFHQGNWVDFNRVLDDLIFRRFMELRHIEGAVTPGKIEQVWFYNMFFNWFYGDYFYFCLKFPTNLDPFKQHQATHQGIFTYFEQFFKHWLYKDNTFFNHFEAIVEKIVRYNAKIIHDWGNILSKAKDELAMLHMREIATLIGDIFESVKGFFSYIDQKSGSRLKQSLNHRPGSDPQLTTILDGSLDRQLRNFRFHTNLELIDPATIRITFRNGQERIYTFLQLDEQLTRSFTVWNAIVQGYLGTLGSIIQIPDRPQTTFFRILVDACIAEPAMFPSVLEYFALRLQKDRLLQEAVQFSQRERREFFQRHGRKK